MEEWLEREKNQDRCEENTSLRGFLNLIKHLRSVIIQDVCEFLERGIETKVSKHSIFQDQEFKDFQSLFRSSLMEADPASLNLEAAMPEMLRHVDTGNEFISALIERKSNEIIKHVKDVKKYQEKILENTDPKKTLGILKSMVSSYAIHHGIEQETECIDIGMINNHSEHSEIGDNTNIGDEEVSGQLISQYKMSRNVKCINDLWREYEYGLDPPLKPSVKRLEETYGTSWRNTDAEKKFFNKRLKVIQLVKELAIKRSISLENAVEILEKLRIEKGWNIDWMGRNHHNGDIIKRLLHLK